MAFCKDKEGNKLTYKEFMSRWKTGIANVSAIKQTGMQMYFTILTMIGLLCGIGVAIYKWDSLWWLCIILVAGFGNTCISLLALYQKYKQLSNIEKMVMEFQRGENG